jgi:hypothetical protein
MNLALSLTSVAMAASAIMTYRFLWKERHSLICLILGLVLGAFFGLLFFFAAMIAKSSGRDPMRVAHRWPRLTLWVLTPGAPSAALTRRLLDPALAHDVRWKTPDSTCWSPPTRIEPIIRT